LQRCRIGLEGPSVTLAEASRPRCIEVRGPSDDGSGASDQESETPPGGRQEASPLVTRITLVDSSVRGDMTFLEAAGKGRIDLSWSGGMLTTNGRCLVAEGTGRDAEEGTLLAVALRQGVFACREGFACLLDSPARPTEPRLEVTATGCRFLTPEGVPLIEQSGIEDPEVYRGRVRWNDAGSRYEGSLIFRRIDGAAERVEIDFASLAQPLQFSPQIEDWPQDEADMQAGAAAAASGGSATLSASEGSAPREPAQTE
jgi:hypothetical protein